MPSYEISGETMRSAFPAYVEAVVFHGVEVMRLSGTQEDIQKTTKMLDEAYPEQDKRTLDDAVFLGKSFYREAGELKSFDIYELIVMRKL